MDRTCEHRPPPENSGPSSLNAPTPNVGDRRGGNPRHERGVLRARYSGPRASPMVVAHFFESGQRRRLRWAESRAPANGRRSTLASTGNSCDRRRRPGGATSARPGRQGSPQREPALPRRQPRAEYARRKVESSFWSGLDRSPVAAPGQAVSANGTPRSLDDCSSLRVINSFTAPVSL